jgi:hypothetical protein
MTPYAITNADRYPLSERYYYSLFFFSFFVLFLEELGINNLAGTGKRAWGSI